VTGIYVPGPERRPLLLRPIRAAGGLPIAFLLVLAAVALPAIAGTAVVLVEVSALLEPGGALP
jgi:hypothetical protein